MLSALLQGIYCAFCATLAFAPLEGGCVMPIAAKQIFLGGVSRPYAYEVEYLQGDGASWIDTGISAPTVTGFSLDMMMLSLPVKSYEAYFGAVSNRSGVWRNGTAGNAYLFLNGSNAFGGAYWLGGGTQMKISWASGQIYINDVAKYTTSQTQLDTRTADVAIFAADTNGARPASGRIYSLKLYSSGSLIADYLPIVDNSGSAKMYDRVTKSFPAHYGTFTAGGRVDA